MPVQEKMQKKNPDNFLVKKNLFRMKWNDTKFY